MAGVVDNLALGGADPNNLPAVQTPLPVDKQGGSVMIFKRPGGPADGALASKITGIYDPNKNGGTHTPISGPTYFKEYETQVNNVLITHYLLCDANGCYDLVPAPNPVYDPGGKAVNGEAIVTWALYSSDYLSMTGRPLRAFSMERLGQADYVPATNTFYPHYLITNRYEGDDNVLAAFHGGAPFNNVSPGTIHGEVVEVKGSVYFDKANYGQGYLSRNAWLYSSANGYLYSNLPSIINGATNANGMSAITWIIPKEYISQANVPSAIKRSIGLATSSGTSSFILEQPTYSDRPY
jgi:hypothetical protein